VLAVQGAAVQEKPMQQQQATTEHKTPVAAAVAVDT
jgi:hypothetical protein